MRVLSRTSLWLGPLCCLLAVSARGQEPLRPSIAREQAQETTLPNVYNLKAGPVLFRVNAALRAEFVDNVNLANGRNAPIESDFILTPQLGLDVNWTISKLNTLHLQTTLGYTYYFSHPELDSSTLLFSPDSALRFNIYVGDFRITLRDQFSYEEDPIGQAGAGNVAKFGRFINTAGVDVLWDLNDLIATVSYDHTNLITTEATTSSGNTEDISSLDHTVDQISGSAFLTFNSAFGAGLETTASSIRFPNDARGDYTRFTVGPFLSSQLTRFTKITASAGYQQSFFQNSGDVRLRTENGVVFRGGTSQGDGQGGTYYATLNIANRLNRYLVSNLSVGHDTEVGLFSQQSKVTYVNLSFRYQVAPQIFISTALNYSDVDESGSFSNLTGQVGGLRYRTLGLSVSTDYQITKNLSASLGYQFVHRDGGSSGVVGAEDQDYTQNRVVLILGYQF